MWQHAVQPSETSDITKMKTSDLLKNVSGMPGVVVTEKRGEKTLVDLTQSEEATKSFISQLDTDKIGRAHV